MPYVVLILGIVALYLYYLLMRWLVVVAGPELLVIASLGVVAYVPVAFGKALYRVFCRGVSRRLAFVPVVTLLALIYVDFAGLVVLALRSLAPSTAGFALGQPVGLIAIRSLPNNQIVQLLSYLGLSGTTTILVASAGVKMAAITPFLLLARGLRGEQDDTRQPAKIQYFFAEASSDIGQVVSRAWTDIAQNSRAFLRRLIEVNKTGAGVVLWPLSLTVLLAFVPGTIAGIIVAVALVLFHSVAIMVFAILNLLFAFSLHLIERAILLARRGRIICPYSACHKPVPLPVFRCPSCGVAHDRLVPGRTGVLRRICTCGQALPTLFWLGKNDLPADCPHCHHSMHSSLFTESVHLPIYGGPSAGKSMFMLAGASRLLDGAVPDLKAALIDGGLRRTYERRWRPQFDRGEAPDKTTDTFPDAFLIALERRGGSPLSLYLYDPAGEALDDRSVMQGHRFLEYADALALIIDPLALSGMQRDGVSTRLGTARNDPRGDVDRLLVGLETQGVLDRRRVSRLRVAVVVSKIDLPEVSSAFDAELSASPKLWGDAGADESRRVKEWLARSEPAIPQMLEQHFADVRYFAVSSTGGGGDGQAFEPQGVLQPLTWLLSHRSALSRPRLSRTIGWLREAVAVGLVLGLLAGIPLGLASLPDTTVPVVDVVSSLPQEPRLVPKPAPPPADLRVEPVVEVTLAQPDGETPPPAAGGGSQAASQSRKSPVAPRSKTTMAPR